MPSALLILVAGPYRSNTDDDPAKIAANMQVMNEAALEIFRRGHIPITGEALALPLIELAGSSRVGDKIFQEIFHPLAHRLIDKVDCILRVGGASLGADDMMRLGRAHRKVLYHRLEDIGFVNEHGSTAGS